MRIKRPFLKSESFWRPMEWVPVARTPGTCLAEGADIPEEEDIPAITPFKPRALGLPHGEPDTFSGSLEGAASLQERSKKIKPCRWFFHIKFWITSGRHLIALRSVKGKVVAGVEQDQVGALWSVTALGSGEGLMSPMVAADQQQRNETNHVEKFWAICISLLIFLRHSRKLDESRSKNSF